MNHNIGTLSSGTLKPEDLIPCFISHLESQKPLRREHRQLIRAIEARMNASDTLGIRYWYYESDEVSEDLDALVEALTEYAPVYFYFGAHPNDGADFGFWLDESFSEDFDGLKVNDLSEVPRG